MAMKIASGVQCNCSSLVYEPPYSWPFLLKLFHARFSITGFSAIDMMPFVNRQKYYVFGM